MDAQAGGFIFGMLCAFGCALVLVPAFGAVILRLAIAGYNKYAGDPYNPEPVATPSFLKAMGIVFVIIVLNQIVSFGVGAVIGVLGAFSGAGGGPEIQLIAGLASLPFSLAIMTVMLKLMLPTDWKAALIISVCYIVIGLLIGCVLGAIIFGLGFALS